MGEIERYDILVVGGGSAGLAAAVSAGRMGMRTLLVERSAVLGGMAPSALVHSICGLYELPSSIEGGLPVESNQGFAAEFARELIQGGGAGLPVRMGRVWVLLQHPTEFALTADQFARRTANLEVRLHTEVVAVAADFRQVTVSCRGREQVIGVSAVVDASGDGVAAALGGAACEIEPSERLQRPAYIFGLEGVEVRELEEAGRLRLARRLVSAVQANLLPQGVLGAAFRATGRGGEAFVTVDLEALGYDPLAAHSLTGLEMQGRELARRLAGFLRAEAPGFERSYLSVFPARIGVRESRRVVGRQRLEGSDLEQGRQFVDGVARASWPMELRETNRGPKLRYPIEGRSTDIPLGALRARDHDSLFVAGRCISCSHEAQASIRVIGTCLATGEAAGLAAAVQVREGSCDAVRVQAARTQVGARLLGGAKQEVFGG